MISAPPLPAALKRTVPRQAKNKPVLAPINKVIDMTDSNDTP
jgi:hypothetical protein